MEHHGMESGHMQNGLGHSKVEWKWHVEGKMISGGM